MLEEIKKALDCETNQDLARMIKTAESTVCRWGKKGFCKSYERLLLLLLDKITTNGQKPDYSHMWE